MDPQKQIRNLAMVAAIGLISACGDKPPPKTESPKAQPTTSIAKVPDVGGIELVATRASGTGTSPSAAIDEAVKTAILQVNGTTLLASSNQVNFALQVSENAKLTTDNGNTSANFADTIQGEAFAQQIVTQSKGAIAEFKVTDAKGPNAQGIYSVSIEARIAKYKAPADAGKIKIVVAPLRSAASSFNVGGQAVAASQVLATLRQQIVDSLSQTGRFTVLDREFGSDIQSELNLISTNQTANADFAKLGQALSSDLIWVGTVNDFHFDRHTRRLQTSDRELVSFSGGWSISQRFVNVTTRQVVDASTLEGAAPTVAPTTLGAPIDPNGALKSMQQAMVTKTTEAILLRTFPISVVERDGNTVILSQGGKSLATKGAYRIFLQGKELKDPQTGQSLGNMETECCDVVIDRVTPSLSYGTLRNIKASLANVKPGALQVRDFVGMEPGPTPQAAPSVDELPSKAERPQKKAPASSKSNPTMTETREGAAPPDKNW